MKQGKVFLYDRYVGLLTEDETGFTFAYDADYVASDGAEAVSLTLPLTQEPYHDTVLFPFFDGHAYHLFQRHMQVVRLYPGESFPRGDEDVRLHQPNLIPFQRERDGRKQISYALGVSGTVSDEEGAVGTQPGSILFQALL